VQLSRKHLNYILKNENAIFYECGYSCDNAIFLKLGSENFFITDSRYTIEASLSVQNAEVIIDKDLITKANELIEKSKIKVLNFDPKEWSLFHFEKLKRSLEVHFSQKIDFSFSKRAIKTPHEISLLEKACQLGSEAFERLARDFSLNGIDLSEKELNFRAKSILSSMGKYDLSFEPIVAINENSAKPHALPTSKRVQKSDLILVDAGLKYKRYCSDRTRCVEIQNNFHFNIEQTFSSSKIQKIYDSVKKAHDEAISKARVGMKAKEIDKIARDVITNDGFGELFIHSTGHGVGLDIHEFPFISQTSEMIIEEGMVFTIEPGIYIENEFGIRIEDCVVMEDGRARIL
jgi:Xaa-Pro aminopeptidase